MIICAKCGKRMIVKKNGLDYTETSWEGKPTAIYSGDLYVCENERCGNRIVLTASDPFLTIEDANFDDYKKKTVYNKNFPLRFIIFTHQ